MNFVRRSPGAVIVLLLAIAANAIALYPNTRVGEVYRNDNVSHLAIITHIADAAKHGGNPVDFWMPEWNLGFATIRDYPALAHQIAAAASVVFGSPGAVLTWAWYLCLVLTPVSYFGCALLLGLSPLTAAAAAVLAPLISTDGLSGLDLESYLWAGMGMFAQAVAVHFFLWSIGLGFRALHRRGPIVPAGAAIGATVLTHWVYGYMAAFTVAALAIRLRQWRRLLAIGAAAMVLSAYQILTVLQDNRFLNHTRREFAWKFDSFGIRQVLKWMFTGKLLDFGRPPVLSLLALAGTALLVAALVRWRRLRPGRELVLGGAVLWTMLYFGRPFWGKSLLLFGITSDIHLHRFIGGLHVFLVLLAGIALGTLWWEGERRRVASAVTIAVTLAMLYPMVRERVEYIQYSASEAREAEAELDNRRPALQRIAELVHERGGRVYDRPLSLVPADLFARRAPARGRDHVKAAYEGLPFYVYAASLGVPVVPESFDSLPLTAEVVTDFAEGDANHYRLFGVTTLVEPVRTAAPPIPFLGNAEIAGDFRVYQAPPTGYFELVNVAATRPVTRNTFPIANDAWLASDWPSRRTHLRLVLDGSAPEAIVILPPFPGTPPAGEILEQGPQAVRFRAAQDCTMLFKMTWHPNWRAYLDGKSTEVIMLSSGMMGAAAPKGEHRIDWRYEGSSYRPLLAALGVLLTAGAAWWEKKKRAGSKPTQSSAIGI